MGAAASLFVDVRANVSSAVTGLKKTEAQFVATGSAAKKMDAQVAATSANSTRAIGKSEKATRSHTKATNAARGAVQGFGGASMAAQGGAIALAYGFTKSIKNAGDFDSAMRNVNSIAGLSEGKFKTLKGSVLALSGPTAQAPQTLAEGMYQLVSSGFNASDSLKIIKSSAVAATAGLTDTATATTAVAGVLNAYHLKAKDAQQVSDDLFQTVNLGVLSFQDLAQGIGPVLPFASRLGISLKQVGAMTSTLTKAGVPAAEAFTYQKGAMAQLLKPTADLNAQYKKLGVNSGSELVRKTGSFQGALEALFTSVGGNDKKFAKLFPDIRGLSAAFTATGSGAKGAAKDLADFNNTAGATARVFKEQKRGDAFGFKQLNADAQQLSITLGGPLAHNLSQALHPVNKGAQSGTGKNILKVLTAGIPQAVSEIKSRYNKAFGEIGKGASSSQVKGGYRIKVDNSGALKSIGPVKRGLDSIPGITTAKIVVNPPNPGLITRTRTELNKLAQPLTIRTTISKKTGNAATVVSQPVKMTADNSDVKAKAAQATKFVANVNNAKANPKITAHSNANAVKTQTLQALADVNGKSATATVNVNYVPHGKKPPGLAGGGRVKSSLTEVNERGPESITGPAGQTAMLGNGKRQIMPLPVGWHVNTAADTRNMQHLAGGGFVKPKRKKGEKHDKFQARLQKWRDKVDRRNSAIDRTSGIKDSKADERGAKIPLIVDKDGNTVENTSALDAQNVSRAERHLAEAKKKKGSDRASAVAAARAEVAEAKKNQALNLAAMKDNTDALAAQTAAVEAQTAAINDLNKNIAESNRLTSTTHNVSMDQVTRGVLDIFNKGMGGRLAMSQRTNGPAAAY